VTPMRTHLLLAASLTAVLPLPAQAQLAKPVSTHDEPVAINTKPPRVPKTAAVIPDMQSPVPHAPPKSLLVGVPLADVGYADGFRLSNLGGRRDIYIPVPQGIELNLTELVLVFNDISAYDARRNLEILVNDRSVAAIALDGKSTDRTAHIALANTEAREGFLKFSFLYSGAATQDRCIDVRYVGDSLTVRPESAVKFEISDTVAPNITAAVALMPRDVAILLSNPQPPPSDIATALILARSLAAISRTVTFYHGIETLPEVVKTADRRTWVRGLIVVGPYDRVAAHIDDPVATLTSAAAKPSVDNTLTVVRIGGAPALLITDTALVRTGSLLGKPSLAALRDTSAASVGQVTALQGPMDRVSFDALALVPAQAEVFGRADLSVAIANRALPSGTRPSRLLLDVMVAPDGAGEKAVVSAFVNERLLASSVAAIGEATRLDFPLPDGLVGSVANIRVVVQRRSSQGDCRFEPQGYPAEILGSSSVVLSPANPVAENFSDLAALWANGVEVLVPASAAARPLALLSLVSDVLDALSKETAPIVVKFVDPGATPTPDGPFIAVSNVPPAGVTQRVRFDRGRVLVTDRANRTRLDIGGLATGAVAQIVASGAYPGLWIKSLAADGALPISPAVNLDRGDVAFFDKTGVALALSTERDTLLQISYPDQGSWLTLAERFRSWIIGGVWALLTIVLLFVLQRIYRRRTHTPGE
jgi:hypothetical protein